MAAKKSALPATKTPHVIQIGDKIPSLSLPNQDGKLISLGDFKGKKVIVYFYPKDLTSGCTQQACEFQEALPQLSKEGIVLLGISKDSCATHQKFRDKYNLRFDLLSDEHGAMCQAFDVWKEKSLYGRKYMGIERSTFLIDEMGVMRAAFRKVKTKGHAELILKAWNTLEKKRGSL